jgi:transposase
LYAIVFTEKNLFSAKHYIEELGLASLFDKYVPNANGADIDPAQVLCLMVMNIMVSAKPLYKVEEWLHDYLDGLTEDRFEANKYNDDRLARNLDLLFDADRASFMAELSANAIQVHQLITEKIHNDSTSVSFSGAYEDEDPDAVKLLQGFNKDHHPDCKQLVFGLNVTEDGHIPLSYQVYKGNQADVTTHIPNWEQLRKLLGKDDFIYVADSKLCSYENLGTLHQNGGLFIPVMPRTFHEVKDFLVSVREGEEIEGSSMNWNFRIAGKKDASSDIASMKANRRVQVTASCGCTVKPKKRLSVRPESNELQKPNTH